MKKLFLMSAMVVLVMSALTGCNRDFVLDSSMKESLAEAISEETYEVINIDGMAYFRIDADHVQLVNTEGNPISYEDGKNHILVTQNLEFSSDDKGFTCIVADSKTGVKWIYSVRVVGNVSLLDKSVLYEADVDLILDENGLPKIDK